MTRLFMGVAIGASVLGGALAADDFTEEELTEIATDAGLAPAAFLVAGDPDYGEYLSGECTSCHQTSGDHDGIPPIIGWPDPYFRLAMYEYKNGQRAHPVMQMIAGRLGEEEIASLAAYFGNLEQ